TIRNPKLLDGDDKLKHFDVVVANPPFVTSSGPSASPNRLSSASPTGWPTAVRHCHLDGMGWA
ncbi:MAG: hypothetical protein B7Z23_04975, partial [Pseudomonadales bacterium 32-61-5]